MLSCQVEEEIAPLSSDVDSETAESQATEIITRSPEITRSSGNANVPDPIYQLYQAQIPVYIYFPAGLIRPDIRYMTDDYNVPSLKEQNSDPSHPNRRWILGRNSSGLYSLKSLNHNNYLIVKSLNLSDSHIGLTKNTQNIYVWDFRELDPESERYNIIGHPTSSYVTVGGNYVMQAEAYQNDGIRGRVNLYNNFARWTVSPVESFEIMEFTYDFLPGDTFTVENIELDTKFAQNSMSYPIERTLSFSKTKTNESTFSKTHKISVSASVGTTFKLKIPFILNGELNTSITGSSEWTNIDGGSESYNVQFSTSDKIIVPPNSTVVAKYTCALYRTNITYVAKLKGSVTGRIIYLKGRWDSVLHQEERIHYYYENGTPASMEELNVRHLY